MESLHLTSVSGRLHGKHHDYRVVKYTGPSASKQCKLQCFNVPSTSR